MMHSLFLLIFSLFAVSSAVKDKSYSDVLSRLADDCKLSFESKLTQNLAKLPETKRKKFSSLTNIYGKANSAIFSSWRGEKDAQGDYEQLASLYKTLNYADVAALQLLRKSCLDDGLFNPKTDAHLCESYPKTMVKVIEGRIGYISGYFLYADDLLKTPPGWVEHAREVLKLLETDPDGNARAYVLENALLKSIQDKLEGRAPEDLIPRPPTSPLPRMSNQPSLVYTPGARVNVSVQLAPQPEIMLQGPPVIPPTYPPQVGPVQGQALNGQVVQGQVVQGQIQNGSLQGQVQNGQIMNGQVINSPAFGSNIQGQVQNMYSGVQQQQQQPCNGGTNIIAIPMVPITSLGQLGGAGFQFGNNHSNCNGNGNGNGNSNSNSNNNSNSNGNSNANSNANTSNPTSTNTTPTNTNAESTNTTSTNVPKPKAKSRFTSLFGY